LLAEEPVGPVVDVGAVAATDGGDRPQRCHVS
jgi:hypothetical protein